MAIRPFAKNLSGSPKGRIRRQARESPRRWFPSSRSPSRPTTGPATSSATSTMPSLDALRLSTGPELHRLLMMLRRWRAEILAHHRASAPMAR